MAGKKKLKTKVESTPELSDTDLDKVAGGNSQPTTTTTTTTTTPSKTIGKVRPARVAITYD
jgi:hypothetical protein